LDTVYKAAAQYLEILRRLRASEAVKKSVSSSEPVKNPSSPEERGRPGRPLSFVSNNDFFTASENVVTAALSGHSAASRRR